MTIDAFNAAQATFGPFYARDTAQAILDVSVVVSVAMMATTATKPTTTQDIEAVASAPWFHGHISRQVAEERLKVTHRELGTFLVRMSVRSRRRARWSCRAL